MDSNCEDNLNNLSKKIQDEDASFDSFDMEKSLREFKTELYIKRDQVKQLRLDLEAATKEIVELKNALDATTKELEEKNFNYNITSKKFRATEEELLTKTDSLNTIQMQHNLMITEIENLKKQLQENKMEKIELARTLEVLETKQSQTNIYHNQILKRENIMKSTIKELEEMVNNLREKQNELLEISNNMKLVEESLEKYQKLQESYEKIKKEKDHFEELYVQMKTKYEMLQQLSAMNSNIHEPNLMNKIILQQWKLSREHYTTQVHKSCTIVRKLTSAYNAEKNNNCDLITKNEELLLNCEELRNELDQCKTERDQLQLKIKELEEKNKNEAAQDVQIKNEPVEIDD